jgi:hypothetical protein
MVNEWDATMMVVVDTRRGYFVRGRWDGESRVVIIVNCSYSKRAREGCGKCGNNKNLSRAKVLEQTDPRQPDDAGDGGGGE